MQVGKFTIDRFRSSQPSELYRQWSTDWLCLLTKWGTDLYAGLEFWIFSQPQSQGIYLYVHRPIHGNTRYLNFRCHKN